MNITQLIVDNGLVRKQNGYLYSDFACIREGLVDIRPSFIYPGSDGPNVIVDRAMSWLHQTKPIAILESTDPAYQDMILFETCGNKLGLNLDWYVAIYEAGFNVVLSAFTNMSFAIIDTDGKPVGAVAGLYGWGSEFYTTIWEDKAG